jgi:signal transduction histidine kinase/ligand-binding sensor domain-containing protein/DNA-binding response OmpR family regulator
MEFSKHAGTPWNRHTGKHFLATGCRLLLTVSYLLLSSACLLFPHHLSAQKPETRFHNFSMDDGLSHNRIRSFAEDQDGFLWIGTVDGLNRYDGTRFRTFRHSPDDSLSLSNNNVYDLFCAPDGRLWIATLRGGLNRFDPATERFDRFRQQDGKDSALQSNEIIDILQDSKGRMWLGTAAGLHEVLHFEKEAGQVSFRYFPPPKNDPELGFKGVFDLQEAGNGRLWLATLEGLVEFDPETGGFTNVSYQDPSIRVSGLDYLATKRLATGSDHAVWAGTPNTGLFRMTPSKNPVSGGFQPKWDYFPAAPGMLSHESVNALLFHREAKVAWVGTTNGLTRIQIGPRPDEFTFDHFFAEEKNPYSLIFDGITALFMDSAGSLWVGTDNGLSVLYGHPKPFLNFPGDPSDPKKLPNPNIQSIWEDANGILWIGTVAGLSRFDPQTGTYEHFSREDGLAGNRVRALYQDPEGRIWAGCYGGLSKLNPLPGGKVRFENFVFNPRNLDNTVSTDQFYGLIPDLEGDLWVPAYKGVACFDKKTESFRSFPFDSANHFVCMIPLNRDTLLFGTQLGIIQLNKRNGKFSRFLNPITGNPVLPDKVIKMMVYSREGNLWISSGDGLYLLRFPDGMLHFFHEFDGSPIGVANGMLVSDDGALWISSSNGIARLETDENAADPRAQNTLSLHKYDIHDGLGGNVFISRACAKGPSGRLYFGGTHGLTSFHPDSLASNPNAPNVRLTTLLLRNRPVQVHSDEGFFLPQSLHSLDRLTLPWFERVISFQFAALNFIDPKKNQYAYQMEGFDADWIPAGERLEATYTNLDPGTYTFRVKASNNDSIWNEEGTSILLVVKPPWWRTKAAYLVYALLFLGALFGLWRFLINRERLKHSLEIKQMETSQLLEMDRMKSRFFANISHEFRTPLTLIKGPATDLYSGGYAGDGKKEAGIILRNASRLMNLINELLDLSRLEAGSLQADFSHQDLAKFLRTVASAFESLADRRDIDFSVLGTEDAVWMYFDPGKLETVFNNLLSNAFRFTPEGGRIVMALQTPEGGKDVLVLVEDSGPGIPLDQQGRIFDRFYQAGAPGFQVSGGSGIGLALSRELVLLHKGSISVESTQGQGSRFKVRLPLLGGAHMESKSGSITSQKNVREVAFVPEIPPSAEKSSEAALLVAADTSDTPLLLLVEDNPDLLEYMADHFRPAYSILEAKDGKEGLTLATERLPDLIISDLMMPNMDGFELCNQIKSDTRTSHIPFILLTAAAERESRIEGLETGADDYLTKPFDMAELKVRAQNLIRQREALRKRFSKSVNLAPSEIAITSIDEKFLQKLIGLVEKNMENPDLSVEMLASEMAMSRMQLHRKLSALTGQSASRFIRSIRLARAKQLFDGRFGNVSEVCFASGFNNLSYFAKCFKEQFGSSPSDYLSEKEG